MRYPVYSHNVDPLRSAPICRKSRTYVMDLIANGTADWLDAKYEGRGIQLRDPNRVDNAEEHLDSRQSSAAITDDECQDNACGAADKGKRQLSAREIIAMRKVRNYGKASWADRIVNA